MASASGAPVNKPSVPVSPKIQAEIDPVAQFKLIIATASEPKEWSHVFLHPKFGKWAKQYIVISNVKYDVKKTDSLVTPVMGVVSFSIGITQSEFFDNKQEAEESTTLSKLRVTQFMTGKYLFEDSAWRVEQFRYNAAFGNNPPDNIFVTLTRDMMIQDSEKSAAQAAVLGKWVR